MAKHARFGPSRLDGLSKCIRFKHKPMDDAAQEGTDLHEAYETGDTQGLDTEEQQRCVQKAIEYTAMLLASGEFWEEREVMLTLHSADASEEGDDPDILTFGTSDRVLVSGDRLTGHVIDFKATRVESDHERQLKAYAAALLEREPTMQVVFTHVVAPRLDAPITAEYDRGLLAEVRAEIAALYERIDDFTNPPTPHADTCARCVYASRCPALNTTIVKAAQGMGLPLPSTFEPNAPVSEEDRVIGQALAMVFEEWAKQVKKGNAEYVKQANLPGLGGAFKLIQSSTGVRVVPEFTGACFMTLLETGTATQEQLVSACTLSLAKLAKILSETSGTSEADYKAKFKTMLADFVTEGQKCYLQKCKRSDTPFDLIEARV